MSVFALFSVSDTNSTCEKFLNIEIHIGILWIPSAFDFTPFVTDIFKKLYFIL